MAHSHTHEDSDSYYPEQLCLIAFSGLFGGICLSLYFWQTAMLNLLLVKSFQPFVLISGILLVGLTLVRAAVLWKSAGAIGHQHHDQEHAHHHEHDCCGDHDHHEHEHHHDEHECGHNHEHTHAHDADCGHHHHVCGHEHAHVASPAHEHHHDHEHGWAPWRYMILLVPVILYLLGLPNKGPTVEASDLKIKGVFEKEAAGYAALVSAGANPWNQALVLATISSDPTAGPVHKIDFKQLEQAAFVARDLWDGKVVRVVGQFQPSVHSQREFNVVRFQIKCCGADAVAVSVPIVSKEPLVSVEPAQWIDVTGQIEFHKRSDSDSYRTVLRVPGRKNIVLTDPDPNPYIQ